MSEVELNSTEVMEIITFIEQRCARKCAEIAETMILDRFGKLDKFQIADEIRRYHGIDG